MVSCNCLWFVIRAKAKVPVCNTRVDGQPKINGHYLQQFCSLLTVVAYGFIKLSAVNNNAHSLFKLNGFPSIPGLPD